MYHGVTYLRTLSFEVLNATHKKIELTKCSYDSIIELVNCYILVRKHTKHFIYWFLLVSVSNDPYQSVFNHTSAKLLPIFGLCWKLHVKCTCVACKVDFCRFRKQWFFISILAIESINFCRSLLINLLLESLCSFAHAENILQYSQKETPEINLVKSFKTKLQI